MADFTPAFEKMLHDEGGMQLTDIPGDRGGMTYAGIARNPNPQWAGWPLVDRKEFGGSLTSLVREFYRTNFWDRIRGDELRSQEIAETIFNFAVNTGVGTAIKLAQVIVKAVPDGGIGPKTVELLNQCTPQNFMASYAIAKIARYAAICNKDRGQSKFLLGWINRTLQGLK
jgi:lysozyme family protein